MKLIWHFKLIYIFLIFLPSKGHFTWRPSQWSSAPHDILPIFRYFLSFQTPVGQQRISTYPKEAIVGVLQVHSAPEEDPTSLMCAVWNPPGSWEFLFAPISLLFVLQELKIRAGYREWRTLHPRWCLGECMYRALQRAVQFYLLLVFTARSICNLSSLFFFVMLSWLLRLCGPVSNIKTKQNIESQTLNDQALSTDYCCVLRHK